MFVGCKLPHGLTIAHNEQTITLNGANVGFDPERPWANGHAPDAPNREAGVGLTEVEGAAADALADWIKVSGKGPGPVASGLVFIVPTVAEARKESGRRSSSKTGTEGLDPAKDLPKGLETDDQKG